MGSDNGGRTAAILFSMTASCKRLGIDPFRYLADVLRRLPTTTSEQMVELLPDVWFVAHPQAAKKRAAKLEHAIWQGDNPGRSNGYTHSHLEEPIPGDTV